MRIQALLLFLLWFLPITTSTTAQISSIDSLDTEFGQMARYFETPGMAVAIVKDGDVLLSKGYGSLGVNNDRLVDANTLFAIGSISKSFTPVALAMLVDDGIIDWDDKVITYVPYFELYDPYVTTSFTIRDLLTHRSGLKSVSGGTLWYHSDRSREEIIKGLKYLKPESEFRTTPAYQNTMFIVASKVVEAVIDGTWEDFIRQRIFEPLQMEHTTILEAERKANNNVATAHIKDQDSRILPIEQEKLDNMAPAGSFYSSANDMAKYMNFMLNSGIVNGDTLISQRTFNELLTPQIHYSLFPKPYHNEFTSYGLGWWLTPKNEHTIIEHSGGVDGMSARLMMEKNSKTGVIVLTNSSYSSASLAVAFSTIGTLLKDDDYLGVPQLAKESYSRSDSIRFVRKIERQQGRIQNTTPSLPLEDYIGRFTDAMDGEITITRDHGRLRIQFSRTPLFSGTLTHWHYDTFDINWTDPRVPNGFITFEFDALGHISGFKFDQPALLDVDFTELGTILKQGHK